MAPWHLPTCMLCAGSGWVDTTPIRHRGREYRAVARCHLGPALTEEQWERWRNHTP